MEPGWCQLYCGFDLVAQFHQLLTATSFRIQPAFLFDNVLTYIGNQGLTFREIMLADWPEWQRKIRPSPAPPGGERYGAGGRRCDIGVVPSPFKRP
jgi:hypothetical protein